MLGGRVVLITYHDSGQIVFEPDNGDKAITVTTSYKARRSNLVKLLELCHNAGYEEIRLSEKVAYMLE